MKVALLGHRVYHSEETLVFVAHTMTTTLIVIIIKWTRVDCSTNCWDFTTNLFAQLWFTLKHNRRNEKMQERKSDGCTKHPLRFREIFLTRYFVISGWRKIHVCQQIQLSGRKMAAMHVKICVSLLCTKACIKIFLFLWIMLIGVMWLSWVSQSLSVVKVIQYNWKSRMRMQC